MTPSGIEPATFRFVAQHLNHCATAVPRAFLKYLCTFKVPCRFGLAVTLSKIPVGSVTDIYGRTVVCAKRGDKTGLTSVIGRTRGAKLQCHLPTEARRSPQQPGKTHKLQEAQIISTALFLSTL